MENLACRMAQRLACILLDQERADPSLPQLGDRGEPRGRHARHLPPIQMHLAGERYQRAGDGGHQRGFPRAIRPDHTDDLTRPQRE